VFDWLTDRDAAKVLDTEVTIPEAARILQVSEDQVRYAIRRHSVTIRKAETDGLQRIRLGDVINYIRVPLATVVKAFDR
jgi:hypothetical protein